MEFLFPLALDAHQLVDCLAANHWRGQITGPHGSGKTTLLRSLSAELQARSRDVQTYTLRDQQRQLPISWNEFRSWTSQTLVVIDGYEQLSRMSRWLMRIACRIKKAGLLVTSHVDVGLPLLVQTVPELSVLVELVDRLMADVPPPLRPSTEQVTSAFRAAKGNFRETFFALYDLYQQQECRDATNKPRSQQ